jgi:histone-lysine N-methyltransferase EZH2
LFFTSCCRAEIHGFGCFIREDVKKDEYVTEYRGEILSQSEANRRGKCYDKSNSTFLFERNQDYVLDAMRKGNLIKFANHASVDRATMYPRIRIVNAEHRQVKVNLAFQFCVFLYCSGW